MAQTQQEIDSTTQKFLDIYDITNNLVILKDGTTSLVLTVDAMNFGLLAEEEQDSIMYAYAGLLNSLNYPIQILIKSQTKDVTGYLNLLKEQEDQAVNHVQRQRIMKYREFVSNLIRERNVLDKKFYVTIPAKPLELGLMPISSVIPGRGQTDVSSVDKTMIIEKAKSILEPKRDHLIAQFARIGLYSRQLETQEIIQMFYQSYNPEAFEGQHMDNSSSYTAPLVSASIERNNMDNSNSSTPVQDNVQAEQAQVPTAPIPAVSPTPEPIAPAPVSPAMNPTMTPASPEISVVPSMTTPAPDVSQPESTLQPTTPITPSPESSASPETPVNSGYSPTIMTPTPDVSKPEPTMIAPIPPAANTPTPPAPELPKTEPGKVDTNVPQEVEIKIEHPSEKAAVSPGLSGETPITPPTNMNPTPDAPIAIPVSQDNTPTVGNDVKPMPPLPEIK
jgi:hypothetical protein